MRAVRVIPCLDVDAGRVVKGVNFVDLPRRRRPGRAGRPLRPRGRRRAGLPRHHRVERPARHHRRRGAGAPPSEVFIPFTIGGGIRSVDDARAPAAGRRRQGVGQHRRASSGPSSSPSWPTEFGTQCVVVAIDARRGEPDTDAPDQERLRGVHPRRPHRRPASTPCGGPGGPSGSGPARSCSPRWTATAPATASTSSSPGPWPTRSASRSSPAAGSARSQHLVDGVVEGGADAVLAASIFHFGEHTVAEAKAYLAEHGVVTRPA